MPPIIPQTGAEVTLPATTTFALVKANADKNTVDFTISAADFGTTGSIKYELEMDLPGSNFAAPVKLGESTSNIIKVNVAEFNKALLAKKLPFAVAANVDFRVKASINLALSPIYGKTSTYKVTPFDATVELPLLRVPGDYQGWDPSNSKTVLYSENIDDKFKGFIHILGGSREFKFTTGPNWDVNFGDNGANLSLESGGDNIKVAADGTYEINVNLGAKTYTIGAVRRWGIVGSATAGGWDTDTPMNVFDKTTNSLKITTDLKAGEFKFRANNSWDFNFGGSNGNLTAGGANIAIPAAGNYTITFFLGPKGEAKYTLVKN
ncbi:MAG: SusE domain-containing protein [Bacteroidetes bacterium]|nr:SusE domain-containing protein [Bacteroidota bacterium]